MLPLPCYTPTCHWSQVDDKVLGLVMTHYFHHFNKLLSSTSVLLLWYEMFHGVIFDVCGHGRGFCLTLQSPTQHQFFWRRPPSKQLHGNLAKFLRGCFLLSSHGHLLVAHYFVLHFFILFSVRQQCPDDIRPPWHLPGVYINLHPPLLRFGEKPIFLNNKAWMHSARLTMNDGINNT